MYVAFFLPRITQCIHCFSVTLSAILQTICAPADTYRPLHIHNSSNTLNNFIHNNMKIFRKSSLRRRQYRNYSSTHKAAGITDIFFQNRINCLYACSICSILISIRDIRHQNYKSIHFRISVTDQSAGDCCLPEFLQLFLRRIALITIQQKRKQKLGFFHPFLNHFFGIKLFKFPIHDRLDIPKLLFQLCGRDRLQHIADNIILNRLLCIRKVIKTT